MARQVSRRRPWGRPGQEAAGEGLWWAHSRPRGALHALACTLPVAGLGILAERASSRHPLARGAVVALATWTVLGGRGLGREAAAMGTALEAGDIVASRRRLSSLCGRDAGVLDAAGLARATVESVAENTCDAVVAPLFWGAVAGVPGLLVYRAVNTLDAMVGHRSERYERFGWASARLDDGANLVPARLTCVLAAVSAPLVGGRTRAALATWRRDGRRHPSPNAGPVEASFAGALGLRLGGPTVYGDRVEVRGPLGDGHPPGVADVARAVRLGRAVQVSAALLAAGALGAAGAGAARVVAARVGAGGVGAARVVTAAAGRCR